jgi:nuclear transport factor 2 (NTF2) superfamily protein
VTVTVIATLVALLMTVPMVKVLAIEWWQARNHTATEIARQQELDENLTKALNRLHLAKTDPQKYWEEVFKEQLQNFREATALANQKTEDDGYVYHDNATVEERAKVDSQQRYLWEKADRPGEPVITTTMPNPYCDQVPDNYTGYCHDRKDASDITGLFTCNDGTHKTDWRDCKDATKGE